MGQGSQPRLLRSLPSLLAAASNVDESSKRSDSSEPSGYSTTSRQASGRRSQWMPTNRGSPETLLKNQSITVLYRDIAQAFDRPADHFPCNPESNRALVGMQFSAGPIAPKTQEKGCRRQEKLGASPADDAMDVAQDAMLRFFTSLNSFDTRLDVGHPALPEAGVLRRPVIVDLLDRHRVEKQVPHAPSLPGDDEAGLFQESEVLEHRDTADIEVRRQRLHVHTGRPGEEVQHPTAARVGQDREDESELDAIHK